MSVPGKIPLDQIDPNVVVCGSCGNLVMLSLWDNHRSVCPKPRLAELSKESLEKTSKAIDKALKKKGNKAKTL